MRDLKASLLYINLIAEQGDALNEPLVIWVPNWGPKAEESRDSPSFLV